MPALSFQKQFVEAVENGVAQSEGRVLPFPDAGVKRSTIRKCRAMAFEVDDALQLYTGQRTKQSRKLGEVTCECARRILISRGFVEVDGHELNLAEVEELAVGDGFSSGHEMLDWFEETHGLPFIGQFIEW